LLRNYHGDPEKWRICGCFSAQLLTQRRRLNSIGPFIRADLSYYVNCGAASLKVDRFAERDHLQADQEARPRWPGFSLLTKLHGPTGER
jgi:hypothetical protein